MNHGFEITSDEVFRSAISSLDAWISHGSTSRVSCRLHERKNCTRGKDRYDKTEQNFAKNLFNVLVCVKRNLDWSPGRKPPIDRDTYDLLMRSYEFQPFRKHWSQRKKMRAVRYKNTISFCYDTFNQEGQAEMRHQIDRNDELVYMERLGWKS